MSAKLVVDADKVSVEVLRHLGHDCWKVLRQAREEALSRKLPLHVTFVGCDDGEIGGLGSLLLTREAVGELTIHGCCEKFRRWFDGIGLCDHCSERLLCEPVHAPLRGERG